MRIVTIVGARPQFVKAAMVSKAIAAHSSLEEILIHTGQHYDPQLSDIFFENLSLPPPAQNLTVGSGSQGLQTAAILSRLENHLEHYQPDCVLLYGDTNSTLAGALAASKLQQPIAHVEAGLRSFNRAMPEEINRIVADHLSSIHFAPSETAVMQLAKEGITECVHLVGDVMVDAAHTLSSLPPPSPVFPDCEDFILMTLHRKENTDNPERLENFLELTKRLAAEYPIILPLHPRTQERLMSHKASLRHENILVSPPVGLLEMYDLQKRSKLILTDSGGLQKEAYCLSKPCLTLRTETEWVELLKTGWNQLLPLTLDIETLHQKVLDTLHQPLPSEHPTLYGDGHASEKIVKHLIKFHE